MKGYFAFQASTIPAEISFPGIARKRMRENTDFSALCESIGDLALIVLGSVERSHQVFIHFHLLKKAKINQKTGQLSKK